MKQNDAILAERIGDALMSKNIGYEHKRMFGGHCFMVDDKMLMGTYQGGLMVRVDPETMEDLLKKKGVNHMIHGGKTMKAFLMVEAGEVVGDRDLDFWIDMCMEYNPRAKSSKK